MEAKESVGGLKKERAMSEEAVRKRREREEKRAAAARAKALAEGAAEEDVFTPPPSEPPAPPPETPSIASSNAAWTVTIPASSSSLPWYSSGEGATYATIDEAKAAGIWTYPSTPFERAKCAVYRDLWEKGHYMGGGIRFGADFLVYPGMLSSFLFFALDSD